MFTDRRIVTIKYNPHSPNSLPLLRARMAPRLPQRSEHRHQSAHTFVRGGVLETQGEDPVHGRVQRGDWEDGEDHAAFKCAGGVFRGDGRLESRWCAGYLGGVKAVAVLGLELWMKYRRTGFWGRLNGMTRGVGVHRRFHLRSESYSVWD